MALRNLHLVARSSASGFGVNVADVRKDSKRLVGDLTFQFLSLPWRPQSGPMPDAMESYSVARAGRSASDATTCVDLSAQS